MSRSLVMRVTPLFSRSRGFFVLLGGGALIVACGARGPLDDDGPLDGGAADVVTPAVDAAGAAEAAPPAMPDAAPVVDAAPEGGSIVGCGTCLIGKCGSDILGCVQDAACRQTFQCVVTDCLSGGGTPSPTCLYKCASGDVQGALKIFQIFTCVTSTCGSDCNALLAGLLGGLGGLGGGGGGGGAGGGGGGMKSMSPFVQVLSSHWPELCPQPVPP